AAALQLDERGRDEQELAGHVEVEALHPLELGEVAVDDGRQLHLVEVDLLGQDEVEQQVERALEDGGLHLVGQRGDDKHQVTRPTRTVAGRGTGAGTGRRSLYDRLPWRACSPASSPPVRSTSATTSEPCAAGSPPSTTTTPSTAASTCTRSPCRRTRPSCGPRSSSSPRSSSPPASTPRWSRSSPRATWPSTPSWAGSWSARRPSASCAG